MIFLYFILELVDLIFLAPEERTRMIKQACIVLHRTQFELDSANGSEWLRLCARLYGHVNAHFLGMKITTSSSTLHCHLGVVCATRTQNIAYTAFMINLIIAVGWQGCVKILFFFSIENDKNKVMTYRIWMWDIGILGEPLSGTIGHFWR